MTASNTNGQERGLGFPIKKHLSYNISQVLLLGNTLLNQGVDEPKFNFFYYFQEKITDLA